MVTKENSKIKPEKQSKKQARLANLANTADFYRKVIDSIRDFFQVKDANHRFVMVNKSLADFLGADPDDIIGKTDYDFFPKKIADSYSSDETFILQTGESIIDKTEKNPNDILVSTSKIPYHDAKGNIIGIIGLSKNITKSVAELEYEKSLFDTLMDNINEDIYFKDRNSKIVRINKALAKRYGFDNAEEAVGMSDADFYSEEHASQAYKDEQEIIKTGKPVLDFEEKATYTDKEDRWWSSSKMPWYDRNGKIIGIFGIGKDITDKKNTEEKIKYTSFHDPLTGLYNRSFFDEEMIRLDSERQLPITVLIGDVNGLKLVNDSQGHLKGDELLKIVAQIFRDSFRKDDIISRWGGDEFIVLLPKTSTEIANKIKKRIQRLCKQHSTKNMPVSISIGICTKKTKEDDLVKILKNAESRMYKNKASDNNLYPEAIMKSIRKKITKDYFDFHENIAIKLVHYATLIGERLNLSKEALDELRLLIDVYNISKITLMDQVMSKSGKLTREDWKMIKQIPELGYRIAGSSEVLKPVAEYILSHYEWYNGKGYPRGLKGEKIPMLSRIAFLLNSYRAMRENRSYRKKMDYKKIIEKIKTHSGTKFDPKIVKVFLDVLKEDKDSV